MGIAKLEYVPRPRESSPDAPSIDGSTEKNVVCGVLVTEVHIKFKVIYIELVLCIETE